MAPEIDENYRLVCAAIEDYLTLRERAGLSPKTREQAAAGLPGSWTACHVTDASTGQSAWMGRVIGGGGWYFDIVDMAVLPEHQRRGLGDAVLTALSWRSGM